ncbi:acid protease [Poronia punctata]|nr:acid protease [Poronia punctata]
MSRRHTIATIAGALLLVPSLVYAGDLEALWLEPSLKWYGIDGNWSSTKLFVGEPAQEIDVLVSTSISELWAVESSGCASPLCNDERGGVFNRNASDSWSPMGLWQLGLRSSGVHANGDYGMETVVVHDSVRRRQTPLHKLLVAGINDTNPYQGFFGLGITPGNFGGVVAQGPLASLVEQSGVIPSHSYGFTPGAYYAGPRGVPMSLTLGGYDENRFEPHDIKFSLNSTTRQPQALIRAITATVADFEQAPGNWSASSIELSSFNESVTALIDSSTPYLWLPEELCDRFADALDLKWNETFELYLFPDLDNLQRYKSAPDLSFTFTLSSADNQNNLGTPLDMPGIVNITVSANAFIQSIQYPFQGQVPYGSGAIPYFPLKRTENGSRPIIGRSFLQEAYIITNYETSKFSLHKARFPDNPLRNTSIQTIPTSPNSPYPGPPLVKDEGNYMTKNEIAGIVVGALVASIVIVTIFVLVRRRKRPKDEVNENETEEDKRYSTTEPESPVSSCPAASALSRMKTRCSRKRSGREGRELESKKGGKKEVKDADVEAQTHEVGADYSHERYEMPAPTAPVELDATGTISSAYFAVPKGKELLHQSSYERPREWAQLFTNPTKPANVANKEGHAPPRIDVHYRRSNVDNDTPSPTSSPSQENYSNMMPSPVTPHSDGSTYPLEYPSPIAGFFPTRTLSRSTTSNPTMICTPPSPAGGIDPATLARSVSSVASTSSQGTGSLPPQGLSPAPIQRTPIDSTHVVCLGPLPDNVQLPHQLMMQRSLGARSQGISLPPMPPVPPMSPILSANNSRRQSTADTLGSNYTLEEEARAVAKREAAEALERLEGHDIIHVPQMAHQRYSWEEER